MKEVILLILLIAAMIFDLRTGKIPNGLIVFGWILACIIQTESFGMPDRLQGCDLSDRYLSSGVFITCNRSRRY